MEPLDFHMLDKCSTTETHSESLDPVEFELSPLPQSRIPSPHWVTTPAPALPSLASYEDF